LATRPILGRSEAATVGGHRGIGLLSALALRETRSCLETAIRGDINASGDGSVEGG
jgi:hypothetical protein